jgi:thiol-disulfide isomerase/thioredoxin
MMSGGAAMKGGAAMNGGAMNGPAMMSGGPAMSGGAMTAGGSSPGALAAESIVPSLAGPGPWINSAPLTLQALRGKVVLIDFWTYSCINCIRAIPHVRAWAERYASQGLVVIGVHTPEFAFEKSPDNVRSAVKLQQIGYPVVLDNDYAIWRAFGNQFWPAHYFIDAQGRVRHHHFGEGGYDESEQVIRQLLTEAGHPAPSGNASVAAAGVSAPSDLADVQTPETYVGYARAENFVSPDGAVKDVSHRYADGDPRLNEWGLTGSWTVGPEHATLDHADGGIVFKFHARDLHLVLGPAASGRRIRFRVTLDGAPPGASHGVDVDAQGYGEVDGQRLYQLIRQQGPVGDRRFEIRFLDPGVQAYSFTFG